LLKKISNIDNDVHKALGNNNNKVLFDQVKEEVLKTINEEYLRKINSALGKRENKSQTLKNLLKISALKAK
jgi:hypothetical protein